MSARSADYREAIDHLPAGAILVLQDVPWEAYDQLLEHLSDHPAVRVTYDQGKVEIISPLRKHEKYKEFIGDLIKALADELDISIESSGSTTWKRKKDAKGIEPDTLLSHCKRGTGYWKGRARPERRSAARPCDRNRSNER